MSVLELTLLGALFILLNGGFVAAEFALLAAPRSVFEHRVTLGDRSSARILRLLTSPHEQDRYVATSQLGITLASLGLGMYVEHGASQYVEPWLTGVPFVAAATLASVLTLLALTLAHIVFGEMMPKGIALQQPEWAVRFSYWPMRLTQFVLLPFVALSAGITRLCLLAIGVRRQANRQEQVYTPEELALIVEESEEGGALGAHAGRLLRELFEFGDLTAGQVMVPRVQIVGVPVGATPGDLRRIVSAHHMTRYPVYEGNLDHIVGMLHAKQVLPHLVQNRPVTAADARHIPVVPETMPLDDVLATMQREGAHLAVVFDEHGGTAGLVSVEDLFEEVVGEIDEGASVTTSLEPIAPGVVRAAGTLRLDELGQYFDLDLQHDEVASVSGLVLALLGRPPVVGDAVEYGRVRLEVLAVSGRGVRDVRATLLP